MSWCALICLAVAASAPSPTVSLSGDQITRQSISLDTLAPMNHSTAVLVEKDGTRTHYSGVPLIELFRQARAVNGEHLMGKALASYVVVTARDGYQVVFGMGELDPALSGRTVLLVDSAEGKPLTDKQGPFRIVIDGDLKPARCIRMVSSIKLVRLRK